MIITAKTMLSLSTVEEESAPSPASASMTVHTKLCNYIIIVIIIILLYYIIIGEGGGLDDGAHEALESYHYCCCYYYYYDDDDVNDAHTALQTFFVL